MKSIYQKFNFQGRPVDLLGASKIMFDKSADEEKALFEKTYIDEWFEVRPPQYGLTASMIVGKRNIRFMASIIGNNAATPLRPTDGFSTWSQEIPRMGHKFSKTAAEIRQLMELYENPRIKDSRKVKELEKSLNTDLRDAYLGCKDVVSSIVLQALSNDGIAVFKPEINNPDGRAYSVDYELPEANKIVSDLEWDKANHDSVDFIGMMQNIKLNYESEKSLTFAEGELLMSPALLAYILTTPRLKKMIHGTDKSDKVVMETDLNNLLVASELPTIRKITKKNAIQRDGRRESFNHWNGNYITYKPLGLLGEIQPAFEDNEIITEENVTYMNADGGIRIAKWQVGESTGQVAGEYTQASWRAIPMIDRIEDILCIKVREVSKSPETT